MEKTDEDLKKIFEDTYRNCNYEHLQGMAYVVRKQDNRKFLLEVRTKEKPHENSFPHAHIYSSDKSKVHSIFITKEVPQSVNDLRLDLSTISKDPKKNLDRTVLENLVEWANKTYLPDEGKPFYWDKLKEFYESVQVNPDESPNYPNKDSLDK